MNEQQLKNWRKVLSSTMGIFAYLLSDEEIEEIRKKVQDDFNQFSEQLKEQNEARERHKQTRKKFADIIETSNGFTVEIYSLNQPMIAMRHVDNIELARLFATEYNAEIKKIQYFGKPS